MRILYLKMSRQLNVVFPKKGHEFVKTPRVRGSLFSLTQNKTSHRFAINVFKRRNRKPSGKEVDPVE